MQLDSVVIVGGARAAIGAFGGALSSFAPHELGTLTAIEALRRAGVEGNDIDHSVYGHIITTGPKEPIWPAILRSMQASQKKPVPLMSIAYAAPVCKRWCQLRSKLP